ncbi:unnamed protein product [Phaedon cochleariae]|uniref:Disease resistance R13L4/SHOC-2-like LRR domain-containing protein n=1 Tax=Phaedon cochleariae TaxID=80249 RepID=A0A9P0DRE2_PHACE|nr:unnamed protein product [Phaedon cochleariae]
MFRRTKVNKARLERKLYLARENPEPIFDLSECDIREVPHGIYSLCRVFLKESLRLQNNSLTSLSGGGNLKELQLLRILDISNNAFSSLPDEIGSLTNLQEFYISNNHLKKLPGTICHLTNLKILDVSHNLLKHLPENIGNLVNLRKCLLSNNNLTSLPKSVHKWTKINTLEIDEEKLIYPPATSFSGGLVSMMRYICEDIGVTDVYKPSMEVEDEVDQKTSEHVMNFEQQKVKEFLEIERYNEFLKRQEFEYATTSKLKREQLLSDLKDQQNQFDQELGRIHQDKENERFRLIEQLQEAENNADILIIYLLAQSNEPPGQLLEQEKQEEERLLTAMNRYNGTLRKDDILKAMEDILTQETQKFKEFDQSRIQASRSFVEQESEVDTKLLEILQSQDEQKCELVNKLIQDDNLQRIAVGALLERGDARSWGLLQRIRLVESQLAALTRLELDKKRLEVDQHINDLCEKRYNLSGLLMNLLDQQKERRTQLLLTLQVMEENNESIEDFWLKQYQRLLDKLPDGLSQAQKNIDPLLAQALLINQVIHCLPYLAKLTQSQCDTQSITDEDLIKAGVVHEYEREGILNAIQIYAEEKKIFKTSDTCASAPPLPPEEITATAPLPENIKAISTSECVICLDIESEMIFVPCGHFCCCIQCSKPIGECPLCRSVIESKINLIL